MKDYCLFNYDFLWNDHFQMVSDHAKLLYIKMNFYAVNGFVANPIQVCQSLGYDLQTLNELEANDEILRLPNRSEIFITSYFVHNKGLDIKSFYNTIYAPYWKERIYFKNNRIASYNRATIQHLEQLALEKERNKGKEPETVDNTEYLLEVEK